MHGWEAVMAALGGLLLGLGLGVGALGRRDASDTGDLRRRVRELDQRVVPWLRARAEALGAPASALEVAGPRDALDTTYALVEAIQRLEREELLPFSDTMELEAPPATRTDVPKRGLPS